MSANCNRALRPLSVSRLIGSLIVFVILWFVVFGRKRIQHQTERVPLLFIVDDVLGILEGFVS